MVMLLYKWLLAGALLFILPSFNLVPDKTLRHPFYVSTTEINHNASDKNLEISCRIFTDDFEATLTKAYQSKVDLFKPKDTAAIDKFIFDYIKKHLVIRLDGKPVSFEFVGHEREEESVWSYLQVPNTPAPKKIEISNNILYDAFDQQINIMHVSVAGNRKSAKLNYPETAVKFEF
jgi:hypothetical protein